MDAESHRKRQKNDAYIRENAYTHRTTVEVILGWTDKPTRNHTEQRLDDSRFHQALHSCWFQMAQDQ